jgi:hypothetical protein
MLTPIERAQLAEELAGVLGEPTVTLVRTSLSDTALRAIHARVRRLELGTQESRKTGAEITSARAAASSVPEFLSS